MAIYLPFRWQARVRGERRRKKIRRWNRNLLHNDKELAEHNMLVDLGRNDLGRISEFGSVHVEKYLDVHPLFPYYAYWFDCAQPEYGQTRRPSMPLPRCCRPGHFPGLPKSGPVRSSMNWKAINGASTAEPSGILILREIWTAVSASAWRTRKRIMSSSAPVPVS